MLPDAFVMLLMMHQLYAIYDMWPFQSGSLKLVAFSWQRISYCSAFMHVSVWLFVAPFVPIHVK